MKLLHFLIITIPVAISVIVITIYIIMPVIIPVQPLTAKIIGYSVTICHPDPSNPRFSGCITPRATIDGNNSFALHVGDKFRLDVMVTNPNFSFADFDSASTTFDKNAVEYHYEGCACCGIEYGFSSEPTQILVPVSCADDIANSIGETNATVTIQYHINGKPYSVNASKILLIFPKT